MKVFIAAFGAETNSFAPFKTTLKDFEESCLLRPDQAAKAAIANNGQEEFFRLGAEMGHETVRGTVAYAVPSGPLTDECYLTLRNEILDQLRAAMPVDMVALNLHGAMMSESLRDCEGDFLTQVRAIVGADVCVGGLLDLHAHLSDQMMSAADILVSYKEYPHTDFAERARHLYRLLTDAAEGKTKPVMASLECRTLGAFETTSEPMKSFVDFMRSLERDDDVLDVALVHSFPWGDTEDGGAKVLTVVDGDQAKADELCLKIRNRFMDIRELAIMQPYGVEDAVAFLRGFRETGPVVIGDASDNPGGGAAGDSTYLTTGLRDADIGPVLAGVFWDPEVVETAFAAGEGTRLSVHLGGKASALSGPSLPLEAVILKVSDKAEQSFGDGDDRTCIPLGRCAVLRAGNLDVVVNDRRTQTLSPVAFTQFGLDIANYRAVVVKSSNHFRAGFAPVAVKILAVTGPGVMTLDLATLPYNHLPRPMWPIDQ